MNDFGFSELGDFSLPEIQFDDNPFLELQVSQDTFGLISMPPMQETLGADSIGDNASDLMQDVGTAENWIQRLTMALGF